MMTLSAYGEYCLRAWLRGATEESLQLRVAAGKLTQEECEYIVSQPR
jgi:hypothetical protein